MSIEDIATYKITLEQLSYDIDELIKNVMNYCQNKKIKRGW